MRSLFIPFIISFLNGFLLVRLILKDEPSILWRGALGLGAGLAISGYISYANFMLLSGYDGTFQITANVLLLLFLIWSNCMTLTPKRRKAAERRGILRDVVSLGLSIALLAPCLFIAQSYPYGGWDAWAVWHFKAKFLYLAGENWQQIFDPVLWRSSPHYPLLLPFINVWGWAFSAAPGYQIPQLTSLLFTWATAALLIAALTSTVDRRIALVPAVVLLTLPFYTKTAVSQYADGMLGFFLLAALVCAVRAQALRSAPHALLSGLFCGWLSFSKAEGLLAAYIIIVLFVLLIAHPFDREKRPLFLAFAGGAAATLIPSLLFYGLIAPENVTAINGFASQTDPSTWQRLQAVFFYYAAELGSAKWNGLWLLLLLMFIVRAKTLLRREYWPVAGFLLFYGGAITMYYWMNTYFEILWWLSVTVNRILASVLPLVLWWVFEGVFRRES